MKIETERLYFRKLKKADYNSLTNILQDEETMEAYNGAFTDSEVKEWLDKQLLNYKNHKFGLWAVILKETDEMIGQCGLTIQPWKDTTVLEIGYLFNKQYWHQGYATEAAMACKKYAFKKLKAPEVNSIIRNTNIASQNVALRNGMKVAESWIKRYRGTNMLLLRFVAHR